MLQQQHMEPTYAKISQPNSVTGNNTVAKQQQHMHQSTNAVQQHPFQKNIPSGSIGPAAAAAAATAPNHNTQKSLQYASYMVIFRFLKTMQ